MVRANLLFLGKVQGVGFRYTTLSFGQELELKGWVKNMSDGSVQAVVEGPREKIKELIAKLKVQFGSFIRENHVEWLEYRNEFNRFSIV